MVDACHAYLLLKMYLIVLDKYVVYLGNGTQKNQKQ